MEFVTLVKDAGPYGLAGVLAFLYWNERSERREWQGKFTGLQAELLERVINGLNAASQAARETTSALTSMNATFQNVIFRLRESPRDEAPR